MFEALEAGEINLAAALCVQRYTENMTLRPCMLPASVASCFSGEGALTKPKALYQKSWSALLLQPGRAWAWLAPCLTVNRDRKPKCFESLVKDAPDFAEGHDLLARSKLSKAI